jgi:hypothetical protein
MLVVVPAAMMTIGHSRTNKAVILLVNTQINKYTNEHCRTVPSDGVFCAAETAATATETAATATAAGGGGGGADSSRVAEAADAAAAGGTRRGGG